MSKDIVRINVGGQTFVTSGTTLANAGRGSMLSAVIGDDWRVDPQRASEEIFIDRNPAYFSVLLDLLRTGELHIPPGMPERALCREALYYGLLDHVRAAKWGRLDGNRLDCTASIHGRASGDGTAIRASPDGGCCVAHGSMVHVYDWTLEEQTPLSLDYVQVIDAGFLNPIRVVICTFERDDDTGGMAVFNTKTGATEHKFRTQHKGSEPKNFTAGALASNNAHVFASCRGRGNEHGIGSWDQTTGQQIDFFLEDSSMPLGDACKLQWLQDSNLLLVATLYPRIDEGFLGLLDFRSKSVVWSWTGSDSPLQVMDVVAIENRPTLCAVNQYDTLGFVDTRNSGKGIRWKDLYRPVELCNSEEQCHSKLASWGSQLFSSKNDSVFVFCSRDWDAAQSIKTARLRKSEGATITDIAVGGNRLFVLHNEENVFDVWETPASPQIHDGF